MQSARTHHSELSSWKQPRGICQVQQAPLATVSPLPDVSIITAVASSPWCQLLSGRSAVSQWRWSCMVWDHPYHWSHIRCWMGMQVTSSESQQWNECNWWPHLEDSYQWWIIFKFQSNQVCMKSSIILWKACSPCCSECWFSPWQWPCVRFHSSTCGNQMPWHM